MRATKPLLVFSVLFAILALSGNDTFMFYGPTIFASVDIGIDSKILSILPWIGFSLGYAGRSSKLQKGKVQIVFLSYVP